MYFVFLIEVHNLWEPFKPTEANAMCLVKGNTPFQTLNKSQTVSYVIYLMPAIQCLCPKQEIE